MANFALNYSFSRNLPIPLDEDAVMATSAAALTYVQTKSKCYSGQLFAVTGDTAEANGLYMALTTGQGGKVLKINRDAQEVSLDGYAKEVWVTQEVANAIASAKTYADEVFTSAYTASVTSANDYTTSVVGALQRDLESDIQALSADSHTHANMAELNKISDGDVEKWNAAQANVIEHIQLNGEEVLPSDKTVNIVLDDYVTTGSLASQFEEAVSSAYTNALASGSGYTDAVVAAAKAELQGKINTLSGDSHSHENKTELDKIKSGDVEKWNAAEANAVASSKSYTDAAFTSAYTNAVSSASSHADTAITAAKTEVYDSAKTYTDTEIASLVGSDTDKTIRQIANEELAAQLITSGAQASMDTLEEIAAWIQAHPDDAAAMNKDIQAVSGLAIALSAESHTHANKEVLDGITSGKIAKWDAAEPNVISAITVNNSPLLVADKGVNIDLTSYATQSYVDDKIVEIVGGGEIELTGYAKVEDVARDFENALLSAKTFADAACTSAYTSALASGSGYTDVVVAAAKAELQGKIDTLSGASHSHENKDELDKIQAGDVAKWNAHETNVISAISVNNVPLEVVDKGVNIDLSTYAKTTDVDEKVESAYTAAVTSAQSYVDTALEGIEMYTGGTAVEVAGDSLNVKVAEDNNFLAVNDANELEVSGMTIDATVTSKAITIAGGEWAEAVSKVFTGGTVPAGTTLQSFLESMLCVELFAGPITQATAFTVSCGNINPGINKSGTVEVGTPVTLNAVTANNTTASQTLTARTFTYGYKLGAEGVHTTATTYVETLQPSLTESKKELSVKFTGFKDAANGGEAAAAVTGDTTIEAITVYAAEGPNSITVAQTGDTYAANTVVTAGTIYVATNLGNYYKEGNTGETNTFTPTFGAQSKTATDTTSYNITGANKYFIGDIADYSADYWDTDKSSVVRGLLTQSWATANSFTTAHTFHVGTKQQTVVVPAAYNKVSGKDPNNGDVTFNLMKTFDFTNAQGYVTSYKAFVAPAPDGLGAESRITVTVSK